jgi:hypothetical protein
MTATVTEPSTQEFYSEAERDSVELTELEKADLSRRRRRRAVVPGP